MSFDFEAFVLAKCIYFWVYISDPIFFVSPVLYVIVWLLSELFSVILEKKLYLKKYSASASYLLYILIGIIDQDFPALKIDSAQQKAEPVQDSIITLCFICYLKITIIHCEMNFAWQTSRKGREAQTV